MSSTDVSFSVTEFVALLNQTLEYAYPNVTITGELANFRVSKNRWVYFDLKDEGATIKCFATVFQLPGPLEDGMMLAVRGTPRLHPQFGFSVTVQAMRPAGEGSLKKAAKMLEAKLAGEGLFDAERKRPLSHPPTNICLITSAESAAYRDFMKVLNARWGGVAITLVDVQVQGDAAPAQLVAAIEQCNQLPVPPDVLILTRGGGSAEDLQAFSTEQVTRAVAASRIPTLVAIGHEVDVSLAELAADQRASTPSNAAELLVPDKKAELAGLRTQKTHLHHLAMQIFAAGHLRLTTANSNMDRSIKHTFNTAEHLLHSRKDLLEAFNPKYALQRGFALVRHGLKPIKSGKNLHLGDEITIQLADARVRSEVKQVTME